MYGWLEQADLLIQLGIYLGLLYYAIETCRIRKVSHQQHVTNSTKQCKSRAWCLLFRCALILIRMWRT